jgi:hypothetical protein
MSPNFLFALFGAFGFLIAGLVLVQAYRRTGKSARVFRAAAKVCFLLAAVGAFAALGTGPKLGRTPNEFVVLIVLFVMGGIVLGLMVLFAWAND